MTGQKKIRFGEITASISSAILGRLAAIIATPLMLAAYNFLYTRYRIFTIPGNLLAALLLMYWQRVKKRLSANKITLKNDT